LAGLLVLFNPFATASIPFIILGASCICYALSDLLNYFRFRRKGTKNVEDAVILEETPLVDQTVQADTEITETTNNE
jgi:membrane protein HdeD